MEFTIQDKIDIYHVILGMIEAGVFMDILYFESEGPKQAVCNDLGAARQWYGDQEYLGLSLWGNLSNLKHIYVTDIFPEWYKFKPKDPAFNMYNPWWWANNRQGDQQRCEHIRKVLRSLYKQLP